jgi:hypothetical protein
MREPGETVSEEKKYATQEKYEQNEGAIEASFLDGTGNQRGIVDLWQFLLVVGHVGLGLCPWGYTESAHKYAPKSRPKPPLMFGRNAALLSLLVSRAAPSHVAHSRRLRTR